MRSWDKVFGVGLNKTGTKTLAACFSVFGTKHMGLRPDLLARYRLGQVEAVLDAIAPYESFEDWPYPLMYRELFFRYGDRARFIVTRRRSALAWLDSLKRHSLRTDPDRHCRLLAYGYAYPHGVEPHHLRFYDQHLLDMTAFFRRQNAAHVLLQVCWEDGDGWGPLCRFLDLPMPEQDFPHENKSRQFDDEPHVRQRNLEKIREQWRLLNLHLDPGASSSIDSLEHAGQQGNRVNEDCAHG